MGVPEERKPGSGLAPGLCGFLLQSVPGQGGTEGRGGGGLGPGAGPLVGCLLSPFLWEQNCGLGEAALPRGWEPGRAQRAS